MVRAAGWRPLRKPSTSAGGPSPFRRLTVAHAFMVAGDTLVTMALAGSLFFSISPNAARSRVALYLALTMAPFSVVAPLLGPALDRGREGRRVMVIASAAGRSLACLLMADDLKKLLLFPEAFCVLVLSKAYAVAKSALVPAAVSDEHELVEANSKLALSGVAVGLAAAIPGGLLLKYADARWVLWLATVVFAGGAVAAFRIARPAEAPPAEGATERAELHAAGIVLASSAMALLRGIVGFLSFLVAFAFRRGHVPSWWFAVVLGASMVGTFVGAVVAPRLRRRLREERMLAGSLLAVAVAGLFSFRIGGRLGATMLAAVIGLAASAGKLAFDSLVQRDAPDADRGRSFARFETRFQLAWVVGAFLPVVVPVPSRVGFVAVALAALGGAVAYAAAQRAARRRMS